MIKICNSIQKGINQRSISRSLNCLSACTIIFMLLYPIIYYTVQFSFRVNYRPSILCRSEVTYSFNKTKAFISSKVIVFIHPIENPEAYWEQIKSHDSYCYQTDCSDVIVKRKPHSDIGFYKQSNREYKKYQGILARRFGIEGFAYKYRWSGSAGTFTGHLPTTADVYFKFCLCCLFSSSAQYYNKNSYRKQFLFALQYFQSPQYMHDNGRRMYLIAGVSDQHRDRLRQFMATWKESAEKYNFNLLFLELTKSGEIINLSSSNWFADVSNIGFNLKGVVELDHYSESDPYIFIESWNDWHRQKTIEPSDLNGYDALLYIKSIFKRPESKMIVHWSTVKKRGTSKYVESLISLYSEYAVNYTTVAPSPNKKTMALLHLHSIVNTGKGKVPAQPYLVLDTVAEYRRMGIKVILTVHDFQFIYPESPNIAYSTMMKSPPTSYDVNITKKLFGMCDSIIYPDPTLKDIYTKVIGDDYSSTSVISPHPDIIFLPSTRLIPAILKGTINIAYVGACLFHKGCDTWFRIADQYQRVLVENAEYKLSFHLFGNAHDRERWNKTSLQKLKAFLGYYDRGRWWDTMNFHMEYKDCEIKQQLLSNGIHIVMFLSEFAEAYNYALSNAVALGLTIIYVNHGAFKTRLAKVVNAFPATNNSLVVAAMFSAIKYVIFKERTHIRVPILNVQQIQPTRWYIMRYPQDQDLIV